jgi:predicted nucleic acid-binding protein
MKVIVDTCIWSYALRRKVRHDAFSDVHSAELLELIRESRVCMIGPVRQELLSGIKSSLQFETLREKLRAFPDTEIITEDYEAAAGFFNSARAKGIQGSNTDFLIGAVAVRLHCPVYTTDKDLGMFAEVLPVTLYHPRNRR